MHHILHDASGDPLDIPQPPVPWAAVDWRTGGERDAFGRTDDALDRIERAHDRTRAVLAELLAQLLAGVRPEHRTSEALCAAIEAARGEV
jgi:hypothetical protein